MGPSPYGLKLLIWSTGQEGLSRVTALNGEGDSRRWESGGGDVLRVVLPSDGDGLGGEQRSWSHPASWRTGLVCLRSVPPVCVILLVLHSVLLVLVPLL